MDNIQHQSISRDQIIVIITQTQTNVELLRESVKELKRAVEEMADRFDSDMDDFRRKVDGFSGTTERVTRLESIVGNYGGEIQSLKRLQWLITGGAFVAAAIGSFLAKLILKI